MMTHSDVRFAKRVREILADKMGDEWRRVRPEDLVGWLPDDAGNDAEAAADFVLDQGVEPHHVHRHRND
jgi:hypothetical protein